MFLINNYKKLLTIWILTVAGSFVHAQEISIELGPDEIGENQAWTVTVTVSNDKIEKYSDFPNIDGFSKRGTSSASRTQIINGQISSTHSITMTYIPSGQGTFTLPPFSMEINSESIQSEGKTIRVGPPVQRQRSRDPFRDMFDRDPMDNFFGDDGSTEYVDVKEDAFLALTTSKDEVYVGEGFTSTLSF